MTNGMFESEPGTTPETLELEQPGVNPGLVRYKAAKILGIDPLDPTDFPSVRVHPGMKVDILRARERFEGHDYNTVTVSGVVNGLHVASATWYRINLKYAWRLPVPGNIPIASYELQGIVDKDVFILRTTKYEDGTSTLFIKSKSEVKSPSSDELDSIATAFDLKKA